MYCTRERSAIYARREEARLRAENNEERACERALPSLLLQLYSKHRRALAVELELEHSTPFCAPPLLLDEHRRRRTLGSPRTRTLSSTAPAPVDGGTSSLSQRSKLLFDNTINSQHRAPPLGPFPARHLRRAKSSHSKPRPSLSLSSPLPPLSFFLADALPADHSQSILLIGKLSSLPIVVAPLLELRADLPRASARNRRPRTTRLPLLPNPNLA
jgi:hypothetical protein